MIGRRSPQLLLTGKVSEGVNFGFELPTLSLPGAEDGCP